ncbi:MAG: hypothetical protein ABL949_11060 [Fimbriimonadaceae bacterium]
MKNLLRALAIVSALGLTFQLKSVSTQNRDEYLAGYLIIPTAEKMDKAFNAGFSMYVAAWPLLQHYPGHRFQTGLPSTWMFAQYDGDAPRDLYSDVEGGLGWWRDTRFPTETPKFIMGGVGPNFSDIANGPSHGWGTWEKPRGLYGVAQLSPWVVFPIDGLSVKQGACGELFGYGYLNLPLTEEKARTEGRNVKTGGNCWTLFLNTNNFKGPLAFFLPNFWSRASLREARFEGQLLDQRGSEPNRHVQMETQYIPCKQVEFNGESYVRIAPTSFPRSASGDSVLVHQDTVYNSKALWEDVKRWFDGGPASAGQIKGAEAHVRTFSGGGSATWQIHTQTGGEKEVKVPIAWKAFATPKAIDANTFGYEWNRQFVTQTDTKDGALVTLPQYFHLVEGKWTPVSADQVPPETGLRKLKWERPVEEVQEPYTTGFGTIPSWKKPGPVAGPFRAHLGDGSVVTYYWYRFADQPAMLNADLSDSERERMQRRVEKLHRNWPKNRNYLAPPSVGSLASLDPAQIVKPPKGYEIGYVPIATLHEFGKR